ncbi:ATP-grasp ribosomal peptide maturase [Streptomyces sp. SAJ15]|uniref:ATP-grasp ribosomal peptide maturase n=1 Tax=Streptomyces sp. SAJ15 TaxID=2011095 RepID=UPI001184D3E0|nr:ATP-grasp ribosomal peptide maturase [Streptomyces sp. SAJ15]TVL93353.1 hypothetical protein CD790_09675 [Streptomyces sp. SAJ15]
MTVLILTCEEDVTADLVVAALQERGVPLIRLDPADLPGDVALAAEYTQGDMHGYLSAGGRMGSAAGLRSIWMRRPGTPAAHAAEPSGWLTTESEHALYGMLGCLPVRWMNHPMAAAQARYKPWQLHLAQLSGFAVPPTLITSFPEAARQFATVHRDLVVKTVSGTHPDDPPRVLPTTRITPEADFSEVSAGPTLLQRHVNKCADIRLTCVGERLFAARKAADPHEVDGRFAAGAGWEPVGVPDRIARSVRSYMEAARLAYGAFDFAAEEDGTWWFLECNQGGQFGFVQLDTGQQIARAVAVWLSVEAR